MVEVERREDVPLTTLSPSRIGTANKCGLAFKYQYVQKLPAPYDSGARMFGNAIHDGVSVWYNERDYRTDSLEACVNEQWERLLPEEIWSEVNELIGLHNATAAVAEYIKLTRPTIKAPMSTKQFLESAEYIAFNERKQGMVALCDKSEVVKWPKDEDPFKAYVKAGQIARDLEQRWRPHPKPLAVEVGFEVVLEGFTVRGRIDQLRQDVDINGVLLPPRILDIKTGRQLFSQMDAFLQAFIYYEGVKAIDGLPTTDLFDFLHARSGKVQQGTIDPERHRKLALRILNGVCTRIALAQWEPNYGFWCKSCDFRDVCSSEINLWKDDGLEIVEVMS